ncbi:hypothetical protein FRC15_006227 [Serendipita sp. 397]|nr:hypothetical protein FRC15_006227 [Serendipita sp. 397]
MCLPCAQLPFPRPRPPKARSPPSSVHFHSSRYSTRNAPSPLHFITVPLPAGSGPVLKLTCDGLIANAPDDVNRDKSQGGKKRGKKRKKKKKENRAMWMWMWGRKVRKEEEKKYVWGKIMEKNQTANRRPGRASGEQKKSAIAKVQKSDVRDG